MTIYNNITIDGLNIFYREAGSRANPTIVLLHGYPASSHMYRDLMNQLSDRFHLVAPDYPGFGNSDTPSIDEFEYSFDRLADITEHFLQALGLNRFSLYMQDYGAPVGFRIATHHPEWIQSLIVQNGNAYEEGLTPAWQAFRNLWSDRSEATEAPVRDFLKRDTTMFFYTAGTKASQNINPDNWTLDQYFLDRPENAAAQLELFYSYRSNLALYPQWHEYFRTHQPPTLIVWGKNDPFFGPEGANAFKRDLKNSEVHLLDTGHFALEEEGEAIANHIRRFIPAHIATESLNLNGSGIALEGYDPVSYFSGQPAPGNPAIAFTYQGAIYYFASATNKSHFEADPEKYIPQYGGFCATAVSEGKTFGIDPENYNVTDDKLYLFYKGELGDAKPVWDADAETRRNNADANWAKGNLPPG